METEESENTSLMSRDENDREKKLKGKQGWSEDKLCVQVKQPSSRHEADVIKFKLKIKSSTKTELYPFFPVFLKSSTVTCSLMTTLWDKHV